MEKNNPSNPLWTPCKSFAIPRLSRSSESNPGGPGGEYFMAECHIHNTPSTHRARHCGLVVYMAFSHELLANLGRKNYHTKFSSRAAALVSGVSLAASPLDARARAPEEKKRLRGTQRQFSEEYLFGRRFEI